MTQSIATDANNDIFLTAGKNLAFVTGMQAAVQNCQTAMLALQGEMMYAMDSGMPYATVVWNNYEPSLFKAAARSVLLAVQDVTDLLAFSSEFSGGKLSYTATINTVYGVATFNSI
jgi:hypothetical protein